ncbi:glycosyltransferase family 39 protein [Streptomyces sp. O3]
MTEAAAHRTLPELWALVQNIDAVHGLYYLLMHGWLTVWDGGPVALRAVSVAATVCAAAGVAALGRELATPRTGLYAGVVYAVLPPVQYYAQEGRQYAAVSACVVWATWFLARGLRGDLRRHQVGYTLLMVLACWLHLFAALALVAHWFVVRPHRYRAVFLLAGATVAAGCLPLAALTAGQAGAQLSWLSRPGIAQWAGFLATAGAGWLLSRLAPPRVRTTGLALLILPAGLLITISMIKPYYVDRYVLYWLCGLALLAGATADHALGRYRNLTTRRRAACAAVPVAVAAVLVPWHIQLRGPEARKDDAAAVAAAVGDVTGPGDAVLFAPARRRDWLLHDRPLYRSLNDIALADSPEASGTLRGTEQPPPAIRNELHDVDRVVVLSDPLGQPLDETPEEVTKRRALDDYLTPCNTTTVHGARITVWAENCRN